LDEVLHLLSQQSLTFNLHGAVFADRLLANTSLILFINSFDSQCQWAVALILACICATTSPATAIAVVRELKCKGILTTTMLGLVVGDSIDPAKAR